MAASDEQARVAGRYGLEEIAANKLEPWPNPHPDHNYVTHLEIPEFTCLCPRSGFPDFATIIIDYVPDQFVMELKSLKLYLFEYRSQGIFYEHSVNTILDDLVEACRPRRMRVIGQFNPRGGMTARITALYETETEPEPGP